MSKEATLSKLVLTIGDKVVELTPEQAKELEKILHNLFGEKESNTVYIEKILPRPYWEYRPIYWSYSDTVTNEGSYTLTLSTT